MDDSFNSFVFLHITSSLNHFTLLLSVEDYTFEDKYLSLLIKMEGR